MKTKYNVGDKVRIRPDIRERERYGANSVVSEMVALGGRIATITRNDCGFNGDQYKIDLDDGPWLWTDEMFCDLVFTRNDLRNGMFGYTDAGDNFVIANGKIVYQDGMSDELYCLNDHLIFGRGDKAMAIYDDMSCFNHLDESNRNKYHAVYKRELPKLTLKDIRDKLGFDFELVKE